MTNPTPEEITTALATLYRVPTVGQQSTLGAIERMTSPIYRFAAALDVDELGYMSTARVVEYLTELAARHGLRITTDPGELIGYQLVDKPDSQWERTSERGWLYRPDGVGLEVAHNSAQGTARVSAVYLLPEGGQA